MLTGQCQCKIEFGGRDCSRCALGYRDYPDCVACDCDLSGTKAETCNDTEGVCGCEEESGVCTCKVPSYSAPSGKALVFSRPWLKPRKIRGWRDFKRQSVSFMGIPRSLLKDFLWQILLLLRKNWKAVKFFCLYTFGFIRFGHNTLVQVI